MSWQLLVGLSIIFTSIATLLQRTIMKNDKSDPAASAILFQIILAILVGGWAVATNQLDFTGMDTIIPNLLMMMVLIGSFYFFLFKSLQMVDASEFVILLSSRPLFTIIASTLVLSEGLIFKQLLGVFAILSGIAIVTLQRKKFIFGKKGRLLP